MKNKRNIFIILLLLLLQISAKSQDTNWKRILLLQSTREDVEKVLGKSDDRFIPNFLVEEGVLIIRYSNGFCKPTYVRGWDVAEGIVENIDLQLKIPIKFKSLKIDKKKFKKTLEGDTDILEYINKEEGVSYIVQDGKVETIRYFPSKKYDYLKCSVINQKQLAP